MEYSQVILEMLERIKALESKVSALEEKLVDVNKNNSKISVGIGKISAKYRNLAEYLLKANKSKITLSFSQIEEILGFTLPETARKSINQFWSNTKTHSYSSSWLSVGYKTRVDVKNGCVTFIKNLIEGGNL